MQNSQIYTEHNNNVFTTELLIEAFAPEYRIGEVLKQATLGNIKQQINNPSTLTLHHLQKPFLEELYHRAMADGVPCTHGDECRACGKWTLLALFVETNFMLFDEMLANSRPLRLRVFRALIHLFDVPAHTKTEHDARSFETLFWRLFVRRAPIEVRYAKDIEAVRRAMDHADYFHRAILNFNAWIDTKEGIDGAPPPDILAQIIETYIVGSPGYFKAHVNWVRSHGHTMYQEEFRNYCQANLYADLKELKAGLEHDEYMDPEQWESDDYINGSADLPSEMEYFGLAEGSYFREEIDHDEFEEEGESSVNSFSMDEDEEEPHGPHGNDDQEAEDEEQLQGSDGEEQLRASGEQVEHKEDNSETSGFGIFLTGKKRKHRSVVASVASQETKSAPEPDGGTFYKPKRAKAHSDNEF